MTGEAPKLDRQRWTHIALLVSDVDASIKWYEDFTHLQLLDRREDVDGRNAWMADRKDRSSPFVLVMGEFFEGKYPFGPDKHPALGPFAHIGIETMSKEAVDALAEQGKAAGCLALGPVQMPDPIGYVCFLKDPDGHTVEFSYNQGVYDTIAEKWG